MSVYPMQRDISSESTNLVKNEVVADIKVCE